MLGRVSNSPIIHCLHGFWPSAHVVKTDDEAIKKMQQVVNIFSTFESFHSRTPCKHWQIEPCFHHHNCPPLRSFPNGVSFICNSLRSPVTAAFRRQQGKHCSKGKTAIYGESAVRMAFSLSHLRLTFFRSCPWTQTAVGGMHKKPKKRWAAGCQVLSWPE